MHRRGANGIKVVCNAQARRKRNKGRLQCTGVAQTEKECAECMGACGAWMQDAGALTKRNDFPVGLGHPTSDI